jgi:hypothetical protein
MWLKTFLVELDFKQEEATIVFINNQKKNVPCQESNLSQQVEAY